MNDVESFVE